MVEQHPEWRAHVTYGDTDSMFVLLPGRSRSEAFRIGQVRCPPLRAPPPCLRRACAAARAGDCGRGHGDQPRAGAAEAGESVPPLRARVQEALRGRQVRARRPGAAGPARGCPTPSPLARAAAIRVRGQGAGDHSARQLPAGGTRHAGVSAARVRHQGAAVRACGCRARATSASARPALRPLTTPPLAAAAQDLSVAKQHLLRECSRVLAGDVPLQELIFAKEVRFGRYSSRGTLPPAAIVATKRMLKDPRAEPRYAERVHYVVRAARRVVRAAVNEPERSLNMLRMHAAHACCTCMLHIAFAGGIWRARLPLVRPGGGSRGGAAARLSAVPQRHLLHHQAAAALPCTRNEPHG